uniref:Reverse transcriptase n=1 Tax=Steinernema glaseri TaxID=37863 RepID=A0A1I7Z0D4_9BILA
METPPVLCDQKYHNRAWIIVRVREEDEDVTVATLRQSEVTQAVYKARRSPVERLDARASGPTNKTEIQDKEVRKRV